MKKGYLWFAVGCVLLGIGMVLALTCDNSYFGLFIMVIGAGICGITNPLKPAYICPECGTKFKSKDSYILTTSVKSATKRSLVTCPKCKKTNFCRMDWVARDEIYQ